jgi:DNA-binding GntR family transcriptional regulator
MMDFERPKLLTETVLEHLRELIVRGDLRLGEAISERQLAERLGVSKTPVREALAKLKSEGLVQIFPQRGAFVFTLGGNEVANLCDFRQPIETAAAKLAISRKPNDVLFEISDIVDQMRESLSRQDFRAYLDLDSAFHLTFFKHCGNSYYEETYKRYAGKIAALRTHLAVKPAHTQLSMREHEEILATIKNGSVDQTIRILSHHIDRTRRTYSAGVVDIAAEDRRHPSKAS